MTPPVRPAEQTVWDLAVQPTSERDPAEELVMLRNAYPRVGFLFLPWGGRWVAVTGRRVLETRTPDELRRRLAAS